MTFLTIWLTSTAAPKIDATTEARPSATMVLLGALIQSQPLVPNATNSANPHTYATT